MIERCPYPGCGHAGTIITQNHCRVAHSMSRNELFAAYGKPKTYLEQSAAPSEQTYVTATRTYRAIGG